MMNSAGYPREAVPLQGRYDGFPGHSEPPKDHIIWSLCCFVYSNPLCLGLAALIFSIKARDRKVAGDLEGARLYASTAHLRAYFIGLNLINYTIILRLTQLVLQQ
uniref:Uncharacterized protein n=1 Tax=Sparus aurata TaxID=8175 RepID=A0A671UDD3_SPAAU